MALSVRICEGIPFIMSYGECKVLEVTASPADDASHLPSFFCGSRSLFQSIPKKFVPQLQASTMLLVASAATQRIRQFTSTHVLHSIARQLEKLDISIHETLGHCSRPSQSCILIS